LITVALVCWDATTIPLQLFDLGRFQLTLDLVTQLAMAFWVCDIFATCITGIDNEGVYDLRPRVVLRAYWRGWFGFDVLLVAMDTFFLLFNADDVAGAARIGRSMRALRMARLFRLLRIRKASASFEVMMERIRTPSTLISVKIAQLICIILFINHYVACAWYGIAYYSEHHVRWIDSPLLEGEDGLGLYAAALHWSLTQFSPATQPLGPANMGERMFAATIVMCGLAILTSLLSSIAAYTTEIRNLNAQKQAAEMQLRRFCMMRKVSNSLNSRILRFLKIATLKNLRLLHEDDLPILKSMAESLRIRLHDELYMPLMRASHVFSRVDESDGSLLVRACHVVFKEKSVPPKFDIFVDNTASDHAIYTVQGIAVYYQAPSDIFERARGSHTSRLTVGADLPNSTTGKNTMLETVGPDGKKTSQVVDAGEDDIVQVQISPGTWICEMALWSDWQHCGMLVSHAAVDMIYMDAAKFCDLCYSHACPTSVLLQKLAVLAVAHVDSMQKQGHRPTDIGFEQDIWTHLWDRAQQFKNKDLTDLMG